jgi:hypothetical protein
METNEHLIADNRTGGDLKGIKFIKEMLQKPYTQLYTFLWTTCKFFPIAPIFVPTSGTLDIETHSN